MCPVPREGNSKTGSSHMIETPRQSNKSFSALSNSAGIISSKSDGMSTPKADEGTKPEDNGGRPLSTGAKSTSKENKLPPDQNCTKEPHDNDVLCGRGGSINTHPGNEKFRQLVERRKRVYLTARFKREKRLIACSIVSEIRNQNPPGRFLARDSKLGMWVDIGDEKARDKTSQALRENAPSIRAEIETEINKKRAEMRRAEEAEAAARAAHEARHNLYPAEGPSWGYPPSHYHRPYPHDYHDDYHDDYDQRWSPPPDEHHHPQPIHPTNSSSSIFSKKGGAFCSYKGNPHQPQPHEMSPTIPAAEEPSRKSSSSFGIPKIVSSVPSSFVAWTKSSLSFGGGPTAAGDPLQGGRTTSSLDQNGSKPIYYHHETSSLNGRQRNSGGRSVHFESPQDVDSHLGGKRPRYGGGTRHHGSYRSHSYEEPADVKSWDNEPTSRRGSGSSLRYSGDTSQASYQDANLRQRVSFSPPPTSRRRMTSPIQIDEISKSSWHSSSQHHTDGTQHASSRKHQDYRPNQRPRSPYGNPYYDNYDRHSSATPTMRTKSSQQPQHYSEGRGYSPTPPPTSGPLAASPIDAHSASRDGTTGSSLISQVAQQLLTSWDGTSIDAASAPPVSIAAETIRSSDTEPLDFVEEQGQEVELVEMMDCAHHDDGRHPSTVPSHNMECVPDEARMPPPAERRTVEIDWQSKVGGCHTWVSETLTAASFFTSRGGVTSGASSVGSPISPTNSIEMDGLSLCGTEVYSCAGSIGGGSLCHVFDKESIANGNGMAQNALMDAASAGGSVSGQSRGSLRQMPSWERSFRSRSPSPFEGDKALVSKSSRELGEDPLPSLTYSKESFGGQPAAVSPGRLKKDLIESDSWSWDDKMQED